MRNFKSVIFDLDGTLLDSMWMWGDVAERYLKSHGATPQPGIRRILRTFNAIDEAQYYIDAYGVNLSTEEIIADRKNMMLEFFTNDVKLKTGTIPVLEALRERGVKMCVTTATERELIEPALKLNGITGSFERLFTCDEEDTSKKSPDIFIRAAEFLGTDITETLVVEDAFYAMQTAKKAGFIVAGVYDEASDDEQDKIKVLCDYYWKNPGGMLEIL